MKVWQLGCTTFLQQYSVAWVQVWKKQIMELNQD